VQSVLHSEFRHVFAAVILAGCTFAPSARAAEAPQLPPPVARKVDFSSDIQPLFAKTCYECHGPEKQKGGLRLDLRDAALKGGDTGPILVAGKSADSLLIQVVTGANEDIARMPKKRDPLSDEQIGVLRAWIDQGADWPESAVTKRKDWKKHWAFTAPTRPRVPQVTNAPWVRDPVDAFIAERLEKLQPSPEADKVTLLRRLSLDLIGLPPTIEEVDAFVADKSTDAYEKQVERLLGSPHYGERWGRQWLDAARYADSDGFEKDKLRYVWFYRDWVINALNKDMPYDEFVIEQ
jgi:mono/diheme cytochrome c family protein